MTTTALRRSEDLPFAAYRRRGERLLDAVQMMHDQDDLHACRQKRNLWVQVTHAAIASSQGEAAARSFLQAVRVSSPRVAWQFAMPEEAIALKEGLDVLDRLARAGGTAPF